jgi:hypothetical protein
MEKDVEPAVKEGIISSFLQPLDKPIPMVATAAVERRLDLAYNPRKAFSPFSQQGAT